MSILAMVSFSPFSAAISSSTGATILHGPHQVAQKSTRTGFSLVRTSSTNVASVTFTVLDMVSPSGWSKAGKSVGARAIAAADQLGRLVGVGLAVLGEPSFRVDRGAAPGTRGGDRLPVGAVHQVAGREHAVEVRILRSSAATRDLRDTHGPNGSMPSTRLTDFCLESGTYVNMSPAGGDGQVHGERADRRGAHSLRKKNVLAGRRNRAGS